MSTNEIQKSLISINGDISKLEKKINDCRNEVTKLGQKLVDELRRLPDWECMILNCKNHYDKFPTEFFGWCSYKLGEYEYKNHLLVKKYYQNDDPDGYVVLDIDLTIPLEEQIEKRKVALKSEKEDEESQERAEYERLKKKFEGE